MEGSRNENAPSRSPSAGSSGASSFMEQSAEDFNHVLPVRSMMSSINKSPYCQVVFHEVSDLYTTDSNIRCRYSLTSDVSPQVGDKIALFKVGWTSVSEYITFERAPQPAEDGAPLTVFFDAAKLPKDTTNLYQLCYVTSGNVIAGASTPFSFHVPTESELVAVEDPLDPGMMVFKSRVAQQQETIQKKNEEYDMLTLKYNLMQKNLELLKKELNSTDMDLQASQQAFKEIFTSKQIMEIDYKNMSEKLTMYEADRETMNLLQEECNRLKQENTEARVELTELKQLQGKLRADHADHEKSFCEIKSQKDELFDKNVLNAQLLLEKDQTIESQDSTIKCLQQDCERMTQALKEQVNLVESLTVKNGSLQERLKQLAANHNSGVLMNIELTAKCDKLEKKVAALQKENNGLLMSQVSNDPSESSSVLLNRARRLEEDNEMFQAMLVNLEEHHSKCQGKMKTLEAELQSLRSSSPGSGKRPQGLFEMMSNVVATTFVDRTSGGTSGMKTRMSPSTSTEGSSAEATASRDESPGTEQSLATKLRISQQKRSDLSDQLVSAKHCMDEISKELMELKQDNSCKKNRIQVLELELRAAQDEVSKLKSRSKQLIAETSSPERLEEVIPAVQKFLGDVLNVQGTFSELERKKTENEELKVKVQDLLKTDAEMSAELANLQAEYQKVCHQLGVVLGSKENQEMDQEFKQLAQVEKQLVEEKKARAKLEDVVKTLRAENVGKISVESTRKLQERIEFLNQQLLEKNSVAGALENFIVSMSSDRRPKRISCPYCQSFLSAGKIFADHFKTHLTSDDPHEEL